MRIRGHHQTAAAPVGKPLSVVLASPRGFCAGVERAIDIVERALEKYGPPVYVRHEIVHNHRVVEALAQRGAVFVEDLDEIPAGAVTIFSAHGVSRRVEDRAGAMGLEVIDATCPLVNAVHREGQRYADQGFDVVLIGHAGHPEVIGTLGQIVPRGPGDVHLVGRTEEVAGLTVADPERVAYVTQTTLSVTDTQEVIAALRARFPQIKGPDTRNICYATQNRQTALRAILPRIDVLLVVGARNSSNTNRLREIGAAAGVPSHLVSDPDDLDPAWIDAAAVVGLTAGASAPEVQLQEILHRLGTWRQVTVETDQTLRETAQFKLPKTLAGVTKRTCSAFL